MKPIYHPHVSHHAYQRFCERIYPATRPTVVAHLLTDKTRQWLAWGATAIRRHAGCTIVAQEGCILTVLPDSWPTPVVKSFQRWEE